MNQEDIKNLEKELWDAADDLRGNSKLTAAEYKDPLRGLVLLRFVHNRYEDAKIEKNLPINPRTGEKCEITAQVKTMIYNELLLPPQDDYSDEEVSLKTVSVYQHIYSNCFGGGKSVYQQSA